MVNNKNIFIDKIIQINRLDRSLNCLNFDYKYSYFSFIKMI